MMKKNTPVHYDYIERPKACSPIDFWGQVRRTVNGQPISCEQISIIFSMIHKALSFKTDDALLDMCCGNGRLGYEFFDFVKSYRGVDLSPTMIEIANKNFLRSPTHTFIENEIYDYLTAESNPEVYTKVLWYCSVQYFDDTEIEAILSKLHERFKSSSHVFLGSLPDAARAHNFFYENAKQPLDDPTSSIGRWFDSRELQTLAEKCGWSVIIDVMPSEFYQSSFRFNALLKRRQ